MNVSAVSQVSTTTNTQTLTEEFGWAINKMITASHSVGGFGCRYLAEVDGIVWFADEANGESSLVMSDARDLQWVEDEMEEHGDVDYQSWCEASTTVEWPRNAKLVAYYQIPYEVLEALGIEDLDPAN